MFSLLHPRGDDGLGVIHGRDAAPDLAVRPEERIPVQDVSLPVFGKEDVADDADRVVLRMDDISVIDRGA